VRIISEQSELTGQVAIPGSKSHTIRAVALASLAEGTSAIRQPLDSLDTRSAVCCYRALGADIDTDAGDPPGSIWRVQGAAGQVRAPDDVIDVGNSGTTLRVAMGSAALLRQGAAVFTGDHQIRRRPAGPLIKSLNDLGAKAFSTRGNDLPPFVIGGTLRGGGTEMQVISSQYLTSLLLASPLAEGDTEIVVTELNEKPYVEMTLSWLDRLGIRYVNHEFKCFHVPAGQTIKAFDCTVPADFSSATFFLCAAALVGKDVTLSGLDMADTQGDKAVMDYLRAMGARIEIDHDRKTVTVHAAGLKGTELDLNATPDALPAMAVVGCFAQGATRLLNVPQARLKETDRIAVMTQELTKLGAKVKELPAGLEIRHGKLTGGTVHGHDDHRVVMALAVAGLACDKPVTIEGAEAAAVTFPNFVELMRKLGARMRTER